MRKGESIFKRKDGRYEARYIKEKHNGKAIYGYVYARSYSEVKHKRMQIIKKNEESQKLNKAFNNYINSWLLKEKTLVKESTYNYYKYNIEKHIRPYFKDYNLDEINCDLIYGFIYLKQKDLMNTTIKQIIVILKAILKSAGKYVNIKLAIEDKKETEIFQNNDIKKLENYCIENLDNYKLAILIAIHTGLRIGEVCALRYSSIDLNKELLYIKETISRIYIDKEKTKLTINKPKTKKSLRTIPLDNILIGYLKNYIEKDNKKTSKFLLTKSYKLMDPRTLYHRYKQILNTCDINNHTFHCIRHTFASKCCRLGMDTKSLSEILGHSNIKTTLSIYVHSDMNYKRNFLNNTYINK